MRPALIGSATLRGPPSAAHSQGPARDVAFRAAVRRTDLLRAPVRHMIRGLLAVVHRVSTQTDGSKVNESVARRTVISPVELR